jgi:hypothetical protein
MVVCITDSSNDGSVPAIEDMMIGGSAKDIGKVKEKPPEDLAVKIFR